MNTGKKIPPRLGEVGGISNISKKNHSTLSAVQAQTLRFILDNPACDRWKLGDAIRRGYAPDVIQYIRQKGVEIITDLRKTDGRNVPIGFYTVHPDSVAKARKMLGSAE